MIKNWKKIKKERAAPPGLQYNQNTPGDEGPGLSILNGLRPFSLILKQMCD